MADDFKYHIDHAGSLVRPAALLDARRARAAGALGDAEVAAAADGAVAEAALEQRRLGLSAISDGQYRRADSASVIHDNVEGFDGTAATPLAELFAEVGSLPVAPAVVAKLEPRGRLAGREAASLRQATERSTVLALPAAGYVAEGSFDPARTTVAYTSPELLGAEFARIVRAEIQALAGDGVNHIQLFNPAYALVLPTAGRERLRSLGIDPDVLLDRMSDADAASVEALDVDENFRVSLDITTGGTPLLAAGYDPAAVTRFFDTLPFGRFHVECPAADAARFPLDLVPAGRVVALGLVDARTAAPEIVEDLLDRVDAAASVIDIDDIAISTNGGFAPVADAPDQLSWAEQRAKLQLVEMVARYYWGNEL